MKKLLLYVNVLIFRILQEIERSTEADEAFACNDIHFNVETGYIMHNRGFRRCIVRLIIALFCHVIL